MMCTHLHDVEFACGWPVELAAEGVAEGPESWPVPDCCLARNVGPHDISQYAHLAAGLSLEILTVGLDAS
jgi:hypothetical protein